MFGRRVACLCVSICADVSLLPSEIEGSTLDVPVNSRRQINFAVSFVENESIFRPELLVNEIVTPIGSNDFEENGYLHIVQRRCDNSNRPHVRCELLQVTVNGNMSNGSRLEFAVFVGFTQHYRSDVIVVNIVGKFHTRTMPPKFM